MKNEPIPMPRDIEEIEELEQIIAPQSSSSFVDRKNPFKSYTFFIE